MRRKVLSAIKRSKIVYGLARSLRFAWGSLLGPRSVSGIPGRVHRNDTMMSYGSEKAAASYNRVGTSVVQILEESIASCGRQWGEIGKALEIGCNYGRIVRHIVTKIEPARMYGCDILDEGPKFCSMEFGINALPPTYAEGFPKKPVFDLVYLISVFTHLSDAVIGRLLQDIGISMRSGGVLVFTTHGPVSASKVEMYGSYWANRSDEIICAMDEDGSFFEEYSYSADSLGMSWHTEDRINYIVSSVYPTLQLRHYSPARLDDHQDVFVFQKASESRCPVS